MIGNTRIIEELNKQIETSNLAHSYIFSGINGIGKKLFAFEFAKKILCNSEKENKMFETSNHPDFSLVLPDEKDSIKIEVIRNMISDISIKPVISKFKIYIIDDADKMTVQAQNSLLKTLEEPPFYTIMILVTSKIDAILDTIKSRCKIVLFNSISDWEIEKYMQDNSIIIDLPKKIIFNIANGSIGRLCKVINDIDLIKEMVSVQSKISKMTILELNGFSKNILAKKEKVRDILAYFQQIMMCNGNNIHIVNCVKYIEEAKQNFDKNINAEICIDNMLLKIWEEYNV